MPDASGHGRGKVILIGEHAVVYGVPALVVGLDRGARARARPNAEDEIVLGGAPVPRDHELYQALAALRAAAGADPVRLELELDIPAGAGLGASAALGVAAARAVLGADPPGTDATVAQLADAWETVLHGNPSGVDRAAAEHGGVLSFIKGRLPEPVPLRRALHLVCAVAAPPASTREMVKMVAELRISNPTQFEKNLGAIRSLSENAALCLRAGDLTALGKLMDLCHMVLAGWMLSTEGLEIACSVARAAGALGAKLTGSGGGGAIVALAPDPAIAERVRQALVRESFSAFTCQVDATESEHHAHGGHGHG